MYQFAPRSGCSKAHFLICYSGTMCLCAPIGLPCRIKLTCSDHRPQLCGCHAAKEVYSTVSCLLAATQYNITSLNGCLDLQNCPASCEQFFSKVRRLRLKWFVSGSQGQSLYTNNDDRCNIQCDPNLVACWRAAWRGRQFIASLRCNARVSYLQQLQHSSAHTTHVSCKWRRSDGVWHHLISHA